MAREETYEEHLRSSFTNLAEKWGEDAAWIEERVGFALQKRYEEEEKERKNSSAADIVYKHVKAVAVGRHVHYDEIPRRNPLESVDDATWAEVYSRLQAERRERAAATVESIWKYDQKELLKHLGQESTVEHWAQVAPTHYLSDYARVLRRIQNDHEHLADALEKEMNADA